jgi:uncharacterized protein
MALLRSILFLLTFAFAFAAQAQGADDRVAVPPLTQRVVDLTATLTSDQQARLDGELRAFEQRKGSQIAVLILPTTQPETIEQYSIRVAEQWKIGRKKVDDGAIMVVAKNDRTLRIEVGYGLEGALNDAVSKRIIDDIVVPYFKQGDYYGGIQAGVDSMIKVIDGEPLPAPSRSATQGRPLGLGQLLPVALIAALVLGGILRAILGRFLGAAATGGIIGFAAATLAGTLFIGIIAGLIGFIFTLMGGGRGLPGIYMGSGYGGGGGGWDDSFRGGGGTFGGGGSSGRW